MQASLNNFKSKQIKHHYLSTQMLRIVEEERIYDKSILEPISRNVISEKKFPLKEISLEELLKYRASHKPGFVLKYENRYFYTPIPKETRLIAQAFKLEGFKISTAYHLCAKNCKRLSAAEDCDGGCAKIRNLTFDNLYRYEEMPFEKALEESSRIERYDFIPFGFESFGTYHNCFFVISCKNYRKQKVYDSQFIGSVENGRPPLKK